MLRDFALQVTQVCDIGSLSLVEVLSCMLHFAGSDLRLALGELHRVLQFDDSLFRVLVRLRVLPDFRQDRTDVQNRSR